MEARASPESLDAQDVTDRPSADAESALTEMETLAHYVGCVGRLPAYQGLALAVQLLSALDAVHRRGLLHRSIDPYHLLVTRTGRLEVSAPEDLAASRGQPAARAPLDPTPYTAPEQIHSEQVDHRTDLYAAAVVIYELLTGALPFESGRGVPGETPRSVQAFRSELPSTLDTVFGRALARDPGARYQAARELSAALLAALPAPCWARPPTPMGADPPAESIRPDAPVTTVRPGPSPGAARPRRGRAFGLAMAVGCGAAIVLITALVAQTPSIFAAVGVGASRDATTQSGVVQPTEGHPAEQVVADVPPSVVSQAMGAVPPDSGIDALQTVPKRQRNVTESTASSASSARAKAPSGIGVDVHRRAARLPNARGRKPSSRSRLVSTNTVQLAAAAPEAACRDGLAIAADICTALRCATAEFRQHPTCVRMHAEGARERARLAELLGGP